MRKVSGPAMTSSDRAAIIAALAAALVAAWQRRQTAREHEEHLQDAERALARTEEAARDRRASETQGSETIREGVV